MAAVATWHAPIVDTEVIDERDADFETVARLTILALNLADALVLEEWAENLGGHGTVGYSQLFTTFMEHVRVFRDEGPVEI